MGPRHWRPCGKKSTMNGPRDPRPDCPSGSARGPARNLEMLRHPKVKRVRMPPLKRKSKRKRRKKRRRRKRKRRSKLVDSKERPFASQSSTSRTIFCLLPLQNIQSPDFFTNTSQIINNKLPLKNSSSRASGVGTIHDLFNICFAVGKTFYVCIAGFRIISNPQMTKLEVISR